MALIKCPECGRNFSDQADACPDCGCPTPGKKVKKNNSDKAKPILISIFVVIIILVFALIGIIVLASKNNNEPITEIISQVINKTKNEEKTEDVYYLGQSVEKNGITFDFVNGYESYGDDLYEPNDGKVFLICEFEITNNSNKDIVISSIMDFEAYCDGYSINSDFFVPSDKSQLDGTVAPGKKINGVISYEVSRDWKELEVNITTDFWTNESVKFIAEKAPKDNT